MDDDKIVSFDDFRTGRNLPVAMLPSKEVQTTRPLADVLSERFQLLPDGVYLLEDSRDRGTAMGKTS